MENLPETEYGFNAELNILIAEDNEGTSRLISKALLREGFGAECVSSGTEVLEQVASDTYDLLLLDYNLSDMTGGELVKALAQNDHSIPFVMMTGQGDERIAVQMMKLGARDYLVKDANFIELVPRVVRRISEGLAVEKKLKQTEAALREREQTLLALLRNFPGMAFRALPGVERTLTFVSEGAIELIGLDPFSISGVDSVSFIQIIHPDDRDLVRQQMAFAEKERCPFQCTYRILTASGEEKWVLEKSLLTFSSEGHPSVIEGFITDVTERVRAEEEIKQMNLELMEIHEKLRVVNQDLEKKVEERTTKVNELLRQKEEFINQLAHDLRTPLTPLVGLVPLLLEEQRGTKAEELLEVIRRNVDYMKDLVEKTVKLAKVNSLEVSLDIDRVNLAAIMNDYLRTRDYHFKQNKINTEVRVNAGLTVAADRLRLVEVLDNMVANAVKFMPDGGTLTFDARSDGEFVTVGIRDTGIGLSPEQIEHVFDEFYKADPSRHQIGSAGLGLTICQRIIEKLGGRIWVESDGMGKGATFFFTLPVNATYSIDIAEY